MNDSMTGIHRMIGMPGIPGDSDGKGDYDEPALTTLQAATTLGGMATKILVLVT